MTAYLTILIQLLCPWAKKMTPILTQKISMCIYHPHIVVSKTDFVISCDANCFNFYAD